jgi:hypothetical protein
MRIIERDIRMAGFEYRDKDAKVTYGTISNPINRIDSGNKCCDEVTVIYDYFDEDTRKAERIRIRYWAEPHTSNKGSRHRLYKQKDILGRNKRILAKPKLGTKDVMADYIEDLQFNIDMTEGSLGAEALWAQTIQLLKDIHAKQKKYKSTNGRYYLRGGTSRRYSGRGGRYNKFGRYASGWGVYANPNVSTGLFNNGYPSKVINSKSSRGNQTWNVDVLGYRSGYVAYVQWWGAAEDLCSGYTLNKWNFSASDKPDYYRKTTKITGMLRKPPNHGIGPSQPQYRSNCNRGAWINERGQITIRQSNWWNSHPKGHGPYSTGTQPVMNNPLVGIELILRTKNQYGKDRQFKKKDYHAGNYKLDKTDKYKRDTFSSTVLVRNLAL